MTATAPARLRVVESAPPPVSGACGANRGRARRLKASLSLRWDAFSGEPERSIEVKALARIQRTIGRKPVVRAARGLSHFGEHAGGWFALGLVGAAVDRDRRRDWLTGAAGVVAAHAASIAVKRVVRRRRPDDETVEVLVKTPSRLSFPSSHATSTTAAAVVYSGLTGRNLVPVLVPPMLVSRLVLGVHYPTDVLAGATLGAVVGGVVRRALKRKRAG